MARFKICPKLPFNGGECSSVVAALELATIEDARAWVVVNTACVWGDYWLPYRVYDSELKTWYERADLIELIRS